MSNVASFTGIVHSSLPLQFSLTCICPVSCVSNVRTSFSGGNVHSSLDTLQFSLTFICPVSCVSNVASFTGFSILRCQFSLATLDHKTQVKYTLEKTEGVFSNVYLSCVLCVQCYQFHWVVHSSLPLQFSLTFICPVSCVSNVPVSLACPFFVAPSVFSNVYCPVSCVSNVASF